ncbi:dual specificity protein phosphatase family protein [Sporosarcina sp. FSL K6-1522]|uniref:protein-tyrosine phosphatase family protein n=1 Tax=Sporosarcina sp. FSL K6-1522 TaxID=2921554 RepID=UPI00315B3397
MPKNYEALIPNRIFIGGVNAIDDLLSNEKIDVIYDLRAEVKGALPSRISIHQPIVDDTEHQDQSIQAAVSEVVDAYKAGKNVYFHCNTGRGRAGTIATATLLELGLANSVDEAEQQATEIRPSINVKPPFKEALKRIYEK